jgi:putative oxidoreductase
MQALQAGASLVGRILLATIFLVSGYGKLMDAAGTQKHMADAGLPIVQVLYVLTVIVELGGGALLVVGWKARIPALVLFLFLIPVTLTFHTNFAEPMQKAQFLKNMAIMGGLLMAAAYGPGMISVDGQTRRGRSGDRR